MKYEKFGLVALLAAVVLMYSLFIPGISTLQSSGKAALAPNATCLPNWRCSIWNPMECPENNTQTRICTDLNNCTNISKPPEIRTCRLQETTTPDTEPQSPPKTKFMLPVLAVFILAGLLGIVMVERSTSRRKLEEEKASTVPQLGTLIQLTDYIRRELQGGYSKSQIRSKLLFEGWNEYMVDKAFDTLKFVQEPKSKGIESLLDKDIRKEAHEKLKSFET